MFPAKSGTDLVIGITLSCADRHSSIIAQFQKIGSREGVNSMTLGPFRMSVAEIHERIECLEENVRRRNFAGYVVCLIVLAGFAFNLFVFPNLIQRIGSLLSITGAAYLIRQLRLSAAKKTAVVTPCKMEDAASIEFYRTKLEYQRDFYHGIWFWSRLLILFPGPLVFLIGSEIAHPELTRVIQLEIVALLFLAVLAIPVNLRQASRYQQQINELGSLQK